MIELPIDSALPEIAGKVRQESSLVVVAAPGAGKSTRVPPALLDVVNGAIVMLQPRRVAARAVAGRIAAEHAWELGHQVGYHIRFEKRYGNTTRIRVMTEGILTRMLLSDPYLEGVSCVILDEFHERNLHTDLAAAFLRELQQTVRPELKVVVMSATLDPGPVAAFLGAAIVDVPGRNWPVEILYRPAAATGRELRLEDHVAAVVRETINATLEPQNSKRETQNGDVLVFLPGVGEIERVRRNLGEPPGVAVLPLHGTLTPQEQQRALAADPQGRRKVILATNIAETSLTIDGVRAVIDSGLARVSSYDPDRGMDRLDLQRISQASADQRAGRAGRQAPGRAYRLWPQREHKHLPPFNTPEIERVDLAGVLLAVHAWGAKDARTFGWFQRPPEERLAAAETLLEMLGALKQGALTAIGEQMADLPVHPRLARLLLAAASAGANSSTLLCDAVDLAAILSDDSPPHRGGYGDVMAMVGRVPQHLGRVREQLLSVASAFGRERPAIAIPGLNSGEAAAGAEELLLLAYPDRVARRRGGDAHAAVMVGGTGLRLADEALTPRIAAASLFLALDAHHDPRNKRAEAIVRTAAAVEEAWLERLFPEQIRTDLTLEYDPAKQKVLASTRRYFNDLLLHEDPHGKVDPQRAGDVLARALAPRAVELFWHDSGAAKLLARVALLRHHLPEMNWPQFDQSELRELLAQACAGKKSLQEVVEAHRLCDTLRARLAYPLDRELDRLAPESIEVPSGSRIRLEYALPAGTGDAIAGFISSPPPPVLAVRLQELFGWTQTPRICGGRVPLVLHLLSPGFKPMQITSDLGSFWRSAYFEVRKDLRARYPKHKWPEDPLSAAPEAKGRRTTR